MTCSQSPQNKMIEIYLFFNKIVFAAKCLTALLSGMQWTAMEKLTKINLWRRKAVSFEKQLHWTKFSPMCLWQKKHAAEESQMLLLKHALPFLDKSQFSDYKSSLQILSRPISRSYTIKDIFIQSQLNSGK